MEPTSRYVVQWTDGSGRWYEPFGGTFDATPEGMSQATDFRAGLQYWVTGYQSSRIIKRTEEVVS